MAITTVPPAALVATETADLNTLQILIKTLASVLDSEAAVVTADRLMSSEAIDSLNNTLKDASDRIDVIINPPAIGT